MNCFRRLIFLFGFFFFKRFLFFCLQNNNSQKGFFLLQRGVINNHHLSMIIQYIHYKVELYVKVHLTLFAVAKDAAKMIRQARVVREVKNIVGK